MAVRSRIWQGIGSPLPYGRASLPTILSHCRGLPLKHGANRVVSAQAALREIFEGGRQTAPCSFKPLAGIFQNPLPNICVKPFPSIAAIPVRGLCKTHTFQL
jgi:hypothetical protein